MNKPLQITAGIFGVMAIAAAGCYIGAVSGITSHFSHSAPTKIAVAQVKAPPRVATTPPPGRPLPFKSQDTIKRTGADIAREMAQKERLAKYDTNHNGVMDPDEIRAEYLDKAAESMKMLAMFDKNHNGSLDPDELPAMHAYEAARLLEKRLLNPPPGTVLTPEELVARKALYANASPIPAAPTPPQAPRPQIRIQGALPHLAPGATPAGATPPPNINPALKPAPAVAKPQ